MVFVQPVVAVLGEHHQEPGVCVRRPQVTYRRLLSIGRRSDLHGQLFDARTTARQGD